MSISEAMVRYVAKLERRGRLPESDRRALLEMPGIARDFGANETIIQHGAACDHCVIVEAGFVSRTKILGDGARQIVAFHIPGDAVDLQGLFFTHADHMVQAHAPTRTFWIPHAEIVALTDGRPILAKALWLDTLVDAAIFREWTANIGRRRAQARIAHLFLELAARFEAIGMLDNGTFEFPVTQTVAAAALGLSLVHLNKSLQVLRQAGYVSVKHSVTLLREADLVALTHFNPDYLHLSEGGVKHLAVETVRSPATAP